MAKFDLNDMYFHSLGETFVIVNNDFELFQKCLVQLKQILFLDGLLSRNELKKRNIFFTHKAVLNDDDYISLSIKNPSIEEFLGINEGLESSYIKSTFNIITVVIDKRIEEYCEFKKDISLLLPGERQVKTKVPKSFFKAVMVSFENPSIQEMAIVEVSELLR